MPCPSKSKKDRVTTCGSIAWTWPHLWKIEPSACSTPNKIQPLQKHLEFVSSQQIPPHTIEPNANSEHQLYILGVRNLTQNLDLQRLSNLTLNPVDTRLKSNNAKEWKGNWAVVLIFNWNNFSEHSVSSTWSTQAWKAILVVLPGDLFLVHMHFAIEVQSVKYVEL